MVSSKFLAAAAAAAQVALATPTPARLAERGEGVHMYHCRPFGGAGAPQTWLNIVAYCANDADCSNIRHSFNSADVCVWNTSRQEEVYRNWGGGPQSCTFPTGVTFSWNIPSNAQSLPNFSPVGSGSNGFRSFAGFKDDGQGPSYNDHSCVKIYYYI